MAGSCQRNGADSNAASGVVVAILSLRTLYRPCGDSDHPATGGKASGARCGIDRISPRASPSSGDFVSQQLRSHWKCSSVSFTRSFLSCPWWDKKDWKYCPSLFIKIVVLVGLQKRLYKLCRHKPHSCAPVPPAPHQKNERRSTLPCLSDWMESSPCKPSVENATAASLALWPLLQGQVLFLIQSIHQMLPNIPASRFSSTRILMHSALCDLAYPHPQLRPWFLMTLIAIRASHHQKNPAGMPLARYWSRK